VDSFDGTVVLTPTTKEGKQMRSISKLAWTTVAAATVIGALATLPSPDVAVAGFINSTGLPSYHCYSASRLKGFAGNTPAPVNIADFAQVVNGTIFKPMLFCLPASVNGTGTSADVALVCYKVKEPPFEGVSGFLDVDLVGNEGIRVKKAKTLCLPVLGL
jgi:hypothetical protein